MKNISRLSILATAVVLNLLFCLNSALASFSSVPEPNMPVFDGTVYATAIAEDGTVYLGGDFTYVGEFTGNAVPLDKTTGLKLPVFPKVDGIVRAVVSDGNGGWYIGGDFTKIEGVTRNYLAHILPNGTLDPEWNPNLSSTVNAIAISGNTIYTGGSFRNINGTTRNRLAAIDTDGNLLPWNPNSSSTVYALAISDDIIYVGGAFTSIGGTTRNRLAAIDAEGNLLPWDLSSNATVRAIVITGDTVYVGGQFSSISGTSRSRLAAIDLEGILLPWDPNASSTIRAIAISGNTIYAGGNFTNLGGSGIGSGNFAKFIDPDYVTNHTPIANAGSDQTNIFEGAFVTLDGSDSFDSDGDLLMYSWSCTSNCTGVSLSAYDTVSTTFVAPSVSSNTDIVFTLLVTDTGLLSSSDTVTVTVNAKPTANDQTVSVSKNSSVLITLTGSDPNGETLSYFVETAPSKGTLSGETSEITYTPNLGVVDETDSFQFRVMDSIGQSSSHATVTISIGSNNIPTANAGVDRLGLDPREDIDGQGVGVIKLSGLASGDADGDLLTYHWEILSERRDRISYCQIVESPSQRYSWEGAGRMSSGSR